VVTETVGNHYSWRVSLRSKFVALFGALAIAPLLALAVFDYVRSVNAVRDLLRAQTAAVAARIATQADQHLSTIHADLALLANNAEVHRFMLGTGRKEAAATFVADAFRVIRGSYEQLVYTDTAGREVLAILPTDSTIVRRAETVPENDSYTPKRAIMIPIIDNGRRLGTLTTAIRLDAIVLPSTLDSRVGLAGYTLLVDRRSHRVLLGTGRGFGNERAGGALDRLGSLPETGTVAVSYVESDSARIASIAPISGDSLAILASASVDEYLGPMADSRAVNLFFALCVAGIIALAFLMLARRLTRPLETLTAAAEEIGRGNLGPQLPVETRDEVGRLSSAFRSMSVSIGEAIRQLETSRQMAAIGTFAAQISHEIRNPLTSIKLNLQGVQREVERADLRPEVGRALAICLREIQRLDAVVRGVLRLGQQVPPPAARVSVHEITREVAELTRPQLVANGSDLTLELSAALDTVQGDAAAVRGALLNLVLNAADALPVNGRIHIRTECIESANGEMIRVSIADSGPGIPFERQEQIFEPFYTTKTGGSGLGLALAARDVETHHGRLVLLETPGHLGGATFAIDLPLVVDERLQ